ncbi:C-_U-editing enzyme APOBEC-1-like [Ctenodactylus gundi]
MTSETGLPAEDFTLRRKIEPQEFEVYFEPREMRRETCLLSEVRWGAGRRTWRETRRNTIRHAEINFIKKLTSEGRVGASTRCSITWFLSWSPCWQCARAIREFLGHHRSVTLFIYVARLYGHTDQRNRRGLRDLVNAGVPVRVMNDSEYCYCWRNFVNHPPGSEARWPRYPPAWTMLYGLELLCIILVSHSTV